MLCVVCPESDDDDDDEQYSLCPPHFIQVDDKSCYYAMSKMLNWKQASDACRYLHPDAHPVAINCAKEQDAVLAVSSLFGLLMAHT